MEDEKEGVCPSSLVGTPEDGSLLFPEHPSSITFKGICEKGEHEAVGKAVLTGKSHKKFPLSQPWSKVVALRVAKPAPTNSMELAQRVSGMVQWLAGTAALNFPQASLSDPLRVALPTGSVFLLAKGVDAHL